MKRILETWAKNICLFNWAIVLLIEKNPHRPKLEASSLVLSCKQHKISGSDFDSSFIVSF